MRLFGLIGYPLSHSFSKEYFARKFRDLDLTGCRYDNYEMKDLSGLPILLQDPAMQGLNDTIPHKQAAVKFAMSLDPVAQETGVVNTLKIKHSQSGTLVTGYNTDAWGFQQAILPLIGTSALEALILRRGAVSN